jgi:hypothetical protein
LLAAVSDAAAQPSLRVVASTGDAAPGAGAVAAFSTFSPPLIDRFGRTAFAATVMGAVPGGGDTGLWGESASFVLSHRAHEGFVAPELAASGDRYASFDQLVLGDDATLYFRAALTNGPHTSGIFASGDAAALPLAIAEAQAPGLPAGVDITSFESIAVSSATLASIARLAGPGVSGDEALYAFVSGSPDLVARSGDPAPETTTSFGDFSIFGITSDDRIGFRATTDAPSNGIWWEGASDLEAVVLQDQPAPGLPGVAFGIVNVPTANAAGDVLFTSTLTGAGVGTANDFSLWSGPANAFELLAREGAQAPGTSLPYHVLSRFGLDSHGGVTLVAELDAGGGVRESGIWWGAPGQLALVAREGDPAPGAGGAVFAPALLPTFEQVAVGAGGDFAFRAVLSGSGVTTSNNTGIWRASDGVLELVVREGDPIELAPGVFRTLQTVQLLEGQAPTSGGAVGMSPGGELAMLLGFADGQAIVVAPEAGAALLAFAALGALRLLARPTPPAPSP